MNLAEEVADSNILGLVKKFLRSGVMENGVVHPTKMGTPQGLLTNIILNILDWKLDEAEYRFVRYADDFVIVLKTKKQAREALTLVLRPNPYNSQHNS
jgi:RNA-directed DNA polymerase